MHIPVPILDTMQTHASCLVDIPVLFKQIKGLNYPCTVDLDHPDDPSHTKRHASLVETMMIEPWIYGHETITEKNTWKSPINHPTHVNFNIEMIMKYGILG